MSRPPSPNRPPHVLSPACPPLRRSRAPTSIARADVLDATWLASLAVARRRVLYLLGSGLCLLSVGGELLSSAHARLGAISPAWPLCLGGALTGLAGLAALGAMIHVARDLG